MYTHEKISAVFEGGGSKGVGYAGCIRALDEWDMKYENVIGNSAGAIMASFLAAGATSNFITDISLERFADTDKHRFTAFMDVDQTPIPSSQRQQSVLWKALKEIPFLPSIMRRAIFARVMKNKKFRATLEASTEAGAFEGNALLQWLEERFSLLGFKTPKSLTFKRLYDYTGVNLVLVATSLTTGEAVYLSAETSPDMPVVWGIRMSMSIPLVWKPVYWHPSWGMLNDSVSLHGTKFVDGGVKNNFPINVLSYLGVPDSEAIAFTLEEEVPFLPSAVSEESVPDEYEGLTLLKETISAIMSPSSHNGVWPGYVCVLPAGGFGALEFNASTEKILAFQGSCYMRTIRHMERRYGV